MPTTDQWLRLREDKNNKVYTGFTAYYKVDWNGLNGFAYYCAVPTLDLNTLFGSNAENFLSSIMYYPFDISQDQPVSSSDKSLYIYLSQVKDKDDNPIKTVQVQPGRCFFNMGEFDYSEYMPDNFQNFADYNGYTRIEVYLPYFGFVELNPNDVMGKFIQFRLKVDVGSGQGIWYIGVSDHSIAEGAEHPIATESLDSDVRILSTYSCSLGYQIPIASANSAEVGRNLILGVVKAATAVAGAAAIGAMIPSTTTTSKSVKTYDIQGRSTAKGSRMKQIRSGTVTSERTTTTDTSAQTTRTMVNACFDAAPDALAAMHFRASSDRVNNSAALINGSESIKIIIYRPKLVEADEEYAKLYGYPLGEVRTLGELSGYTEISSIHIEGQDFSTATSEELSKLYSLLTSGIIL